jgi:cell wall-associated NlpC family hydrolase
LFAATCEEVTPFLVVSGCSGADNVYKAMLRLVPIVLALTAAACASTGSAPSPFPRPGSHPSAPAGTPASTAAPGVATGYAIAGTALSLRGAPYRNGGAEPSGFDCSGFVTYVFGQYGIRVPRTVSDQYRSGKDVSSGPIEPGDLVFFNTTGSGASHVGIVVGGDEFIHAPSTNGEVRVERISSGYWSSRFVGARRVTP